MDQMLKYSTLEPRIIHSSQYSHRNLNSFTLAFRNTIAAPQKVPQTHRPKLSFNQRPLSSWGTIDTNVTYCNKDQAENFLKESIKADMNSFLLRRIKTATKKKSQIVDLREGDRQILSQTTFNIQNSCTPPNYYNMRLSRILQEPAKSREKVIGQPYLLNCREKLRRIVQRSKQDQSRYEKLRQKILQIASRNEPVFIKNNNFFVEGKELIKRQSKSIQCNWQKSLEVESKRYKKRLLSIHNRKAT